MIKATAGVPITVGHEVLTLSPVKQRIHLSQLLAKETIYMAPAIAKGNWNGGLLVQLADQYLVPKGKRTPRGDSKRGMPSRGPPAKSQPGPLSGPAEIRDLLGLELGVPPVMHPPPPPVPFTLVIKEQEDLKASSSMQAEVTPSVVEVGNDLLPQESTATLEDASLIDWVAEAKREKKRAPWSDDVEGLSFFVSTRPTAQTIAGPSRPAVSKEELSRRALQRDESKAFAPYLKKWAHLDKELDKKEVRTSLREVRKTLTKMEVLNIEYSSLGKRRRAVPPLSSFNADWAKDAPESDFAT